MKKITLAILVAAFFTGQALAEYEVARHGMVSSRSDLASAVGSEIMAQGGNAVDAAVAVGFALAVTYPSAGNLGGGGFLVLHTADGDVAALDFREKAPAAASRDMYLDENGNVDRYLSLSSLQASGVPGTVAGLLEALELYGTMSREQLMQPAIDLARYGFVLNEDLAGQFAGQIESFSRNPAALAKFSINGTPYAAGDLWQQPELASTLQRISEHGHKGFYTGITAELIVEEMQAGNGLITYQDLLDYQPVWRDATHGIYRGYDIWSMPAPSSGGVLLVQMLNMLEPWAIGEYGWGDARTIHLMIEAQRRAYADRAEYLGDPDFFEVPAAMLTSRDYANSRFADVDPGKASDSKDIGAGAWPSESTETTHYSVIDDEGNAVSVTTTLNRSYGNGIVVAGAGFLLNNEMDDFSSRPNTPNSYGLIGREANEIEPGKRMLSSMTPTIVSRDGKALLATGSPGGSTIINTVLQVIVNFIDHQMSLEDAVSSPRFHHQWLPDIVRYEIGAISEEAAAELQDMGHKGLNGSRFSIGDANSVARGDKLVEGMSDPRNAGGTAGY